VTPTSLISNTDADTQTEETPCVAAVSLKILPFWPADPQLWFCQVEAQLSTRGINQQRTMFDHIVGSISPEVTTKVRDLLLSPPTVNPYTSLKEQLIKRMAASEQHRIQQLLSLEDLGDRKPTQLLCRMQQLLGDTPGYTNSSFLRELFLQRLPANVRMVLASASDTVPLTELAQLADRIVEVAAPSVSAVKVSPTANEMEKLRQDVAELKQLLTSHRGGRHRPPSPAPCQASGDNMYWYHDKFGSKAQKCRPPCSYS